MTPVKMIPAGSQPQSAIEYNILIEEGFHRVDVSLKMLNALLDYIESNSRMAGGNVVEADTPPPRSIAALIRESPELLIQASGYIDDIRDRLSGLVIY